MIARFKYLLANEPEFADTVCGIVLVGSALLMVAFTIAGMLLEVASHERAALTCMVLAFIAIFGALTPIFYWMYEETREALDYIKSIWHETETEHNNEH